MTRCAMCEREIDDDDETVRLMPLNETGQFQEAWTMHRHCFEDIKEVLGLP